MSNNPKISALMTGLAAAWLIYSMATDRESPSTTLAVLQYAILAGCILGFIGAVRQMLAARS